jgi:hypothetical protein
MIETLAPDRRGQMEAAFEKLMVGVLRNLESRNRDKFTQNLTAFRQDVKAFLNAWLVAPPLDATAEMMAASMSRMTFDTHGIASAGVSLEGHPERSTSCADID